MKTSGLFTLCYLRSQGRELLRRRSGHVSGGFPLPRANGMHDLNPRNRTPGRPKRLEASHRPHLAFHRAMVLLHEIVEILALPDGDAGLVGPIVTLNRRGVAATLIDSDLLREPLGTNGLA